MIASTHSHTPYDDVAYPTAIFAQTHPDRLGAIAQLHGIGAPAPGTARILEVGCGDGMNLLAMAVAAPDATFTGFDLAPTVVERGQARAAAAGLANVELEVRDLMDAQHTFEDEFDYIIAHGLYAWVPEPVREALFVLIARTLAPNGIAFVSYNALPGGYFRLAVRDLMRHFIPADADPATKLRTAREVLRQFAEPQPDDAPDMSAYRNQARRTLNQSDGVLFHDELGDLYHPQRHSDVCAAAERAGLTYLTDAGRRRFYDGFLPDGAAADADVNRQIVRLAEQRDLTELRYFRHSLFVRAELQPRREFEPGSARALSASARYVREKDGWRADEGSEFAVRSDPALQAALEQLAGARPARVPVAELGLDDDRLRSLLRLFDLRYVQLHTALAPFATSPPNLPTLSPLARALIEEGVDALCNLDHSKVQIDDPVLRRFLAGLDGTRDAEGMEALAQESDFTDPAQWPSAVQAAVYNALIMLPDDT